MTKLFREATILAAEEFLEVNKDDLDASVSARLQSVLDTFTERSNRTPEDNEKAEKVMRGQGVSLNAMILGVMLLCGLPQDQINTLPIQVRELGDDAIEVSRALGIGNTGTGQGPTFRKPRRDKEVN